MEGVLHPDERFRSRLDTLDQVSQPVGPGPVRMRFFKQLPTASAVLPQLETVRIPIIAQKVDCALGSEQFEAGPAVLLESEPGCDRGETIVAEVQQDLS